MADRHIVGDTVRIGNTFQVDTVNTDPTTVTLVVTDPSGNTEGTYTYAGSTVTKTATGVYHKDLTVDEVGLWTVKWTGTGTAADVATRTFTVHAVAVNATDVLTYDEAADALKVGTTDITKSARLQSAITAVSRRLDDEYGPIVKRAIVAQTHEPAAWDLWVDGPIYSTPAITITEYDRDGVAQALTLETYDTKPTHGYRLQQRTGLGGGYTGRIRRTEGAVESTWGTVRVAYTAGRYSDTGTVDPVFKEAGAVCLINWWQQVLSQTPQVGNELELPGFRFPRYAIPDAALDLVPVDEKAPRSVLA